MRDRASLAELPAADQIVVASVDSPTAAQAQPSPPERVPNEPATGSGVQQHDLHVLRWLRLVRLWNRERSEAADRASDTYNTRRTPAMLISIIFHTAVLLLLALLSVRVGSGSKTSEFLRLAAPTELQQDSTAVALVADGSLAPPRPTQEPAESASPTASAALPTVSGLLAVQPPQIERAISPENQTGVLSEAALTLDASFSSTGVEGRALRRRSELARQRGGSLQSEQAVERALEWLAEHQLPNGGWSLIHDGGRCQGRCRNNGSRDRFDTAATGLALLAFLGAGYTQQDGKHRETVRRGLYFLLQVMEETPNGGSFLYLSERGMYNHGIATFALCEAYQLTQDKDLRDPAQQAVNFIAAAQHYHGGWGYLPKQPGDLTISGWQVMALKSAYAAGLDVPASTILRLDAFLDTQQTEAGVFYGYQKPGKNPTCTAIGQLLRLFRGRTHTDPVVLQAADYFLRTGRSNSDVYFNYYASLFLFHVGGPLWESWNPGMRDYLVSTQATQGHEVGSWYFENPFGKEGGRLYTTAMCAMTLEVYYRFAPLYRQADMPFTP